MSSLNFTEIRNQLTTSQIYEFLTNFHGEPYVTPFGIISRTICHNEVGEGSRKLYYYENSHLFTCYTECGENFDIFELIAKIYKVQFNQNLSLPQAYDMVCNFFQITQFFVHSAGDLTRNTDIWSMFTEYDKVDNNAKENEVPILRTYDEDILSRLTYPILEIWEREGITREVLKEGHIGYYPSSDQISIPHYNSEGGFVGLRGRSLLDEHIARYGKYHPLFINNIMYSHPLGRNLYNLNNSKENIQKVKTAVMFEGEKSALMYRSFFGKDNDISVACCGSSISKFQIELLLDNGANELVVAFDKDFHTGEVNKKLIERLTRINEQYKSKITLSFIYDKEGILGYKESPVDRGKEMFIELYQNRIYI